MAIGNPGPVIPERYRRALGDDDPVEAMAEAPDRLRKLIRGLTERQLSRKPAPGKWSIKEIIGHLADGEVVLGARYRFIAAHERPKLASYDQDAFVERLGTMGAKASELLDDFMWARAANLGLLLRLPPESWQRVGVHEERGEESIETLVTMYAGHDRIHLQQIETIRVGLFPPRRKAAAVRAPARRKSPSGKPAARRKAARR